MRAGDFFNKYLRADSISGDMEVTIRDVTLESFDKTEGRVTKMVLHFAEMDAGLVMNRTLVRSLEAIFGSDETIDWTGGKVIIYRDPDITFDGKAVGGIRIRAATPPEDVPF